MKERMNGREEDVDEEGKKEGIRDPEGWAQGKLHISLNP